MPTEHSVTGDWRVQRKCMTLSPQEADALFFPPPGGKSKAAKLFCSACPVQAQCLTETLTYNTPGFWAGTTEDERRAMVKFLDLIPAEVDDFIPPVGRRKLRSVRVDANIYNDPLFGLDGPSDDELLVMTSDVS